MTSRSRYGEMKATRSLGNVLAAHIILIKYSDDFYVKCICTAIASRRHPPLTCMNNSHTNPQQQYYSL